MHASGTEYRAVEEPKGQIRDAGQLRGELHQEILSPKADGAILWSPGGGTLSALNLPGPLGLLQVMWQEQEHGGRGLCYCQICCCEEGRDHWFTPHPTPMVPSVEPARRVDSEEEKGSGRVGG